MDSFDDSDLLTGYEPNAYDLMESYVESLTESLTEQQFPEQRLLQNVDYDDAALEEMLHNAHRVHVYHSQREGLSVGQSASSVSERTEETRCGENRETCCDKWSGAKRLKRTDLNSVVQTVRANPRRMSGED